MSDSAVQELGWVTARGTPRAIGRALGMARRDAVRRVLLGSDYWAAVTDPVHAIAVQRMTDTLAVRFPAVLDEIAGMAEGLGLPVEQVVAWNCRGDLISNVPDGCTTVQLPGPTPVIAHNEDGLPGFRGAAFIAEVTPEDGPGFLAFCYPGSIPGHTFAVTRAGLAQAVNNLRLCGVVPEVPRMALGRSVLRSTTLDDALGLLRAENASGGFHFTLAQSGDDRLVSVEFGGGQCAPRVLEAPALHANHALTLDCGAAGQTITRSSADRQARGSALFAAGEHDPVAILRDTGGTGLPIHRTAEDDPDCENTLATAVMHVGQTGVDWRIYDQSAPQPIYTGTTERH